MKSISSKAFTLIELLVVITVMVLLISLVVPSISSVLERSRTTRCASNLKQIGDAIFVYMNNNNGRLPPHSIGKNYSMTVLPGETQYWSDRYLVGQYANNRKSYGAVDQRSVFVCPSAPRRDAGPRNNYGMSMRLYDTPSGASWGDELTLSNFPPQVHRYAHPSLTLLAIDANLERFHPGYGAYPPAYGVTEPHSGDYGFSTPTSNYNWARRHNKQQGANILFLDGHVRYTLDLKKDVDADLVIFR